MRGASSCLRHAQVGHALSTLSPLRLPTAVSKDMQHERSKQIFGAHPPAPAPTTRTAVSTKERKTSNDNDVLQTKESSCAADHRKLGESELHRRREPSKIVLRRVQAQSKHKEVGKCERKLHRSKSRHIPQGWREHSQQRVVDRPGKARPCLRQSVAVVVIR